MEKQFLNKIKNLLSEQLGVEAEDISEEDSLKDDLHMSALEITDFLQQLEEAGVETSDIDLSEVDTVQDLSEALSAKEYME